MIVGVFASIQLYEARCSSSVTVASADEASVERSERETRMTREDIVFDHVDDMLDF